MISAAEVRILSLDGLNGVIARRREGLLNRLFDGLLIEGDCHLFATVPIVEGGVAVVAAVACVVAKEARSSSVAVKFPNVIIA